MSPSLITPNSSVSPDADGNSFDGLSGSLDQIARGRLVSVSLPVRDLGGLAFLARSANEQHFYWAEPERADGPILRLAGSGVAAELMTAPHLETAERGAHSRFAQVRRQVKQLFANSSHLVVATPDSAQTEPARAGHPARPRLFGGFAFSPEFVPDNTWSVFQPAHFILPHFQLVDYDGGRWLTINAVLPPDESRPAAEAGLVDALQVCLNSLRAAPDTGAKARHWSQGQAATEPNIRYPMSFNQWRSMVEQAITAIRQGDLQKVVLSRVGEIRLEEPVDVAELLTRLTYDYANCYHFAFEPLRAHVFLGATPELLIRLEQDSFQTMALAGSISRGHSPAESAELAAQLMDSIKDRHEHDLVVQALHRRLATVSDSIQVAAEPDILRLHNIQHLLTPFHGRLSDRRQTDVLTLVELLHPTPALGGVPSEKATQFLTACEPVPRGWYAAPIGWIDADLDGAFAVAIRSAICQHERAWLYAGAGIVGDSNPQREWAETELKFKPMLDTILNSGAPND